MTRIPVVALFALLALGACSSTATQAVAPASTAARPTAAASTASAVGPSSAKGYGAGSPECKATGAAVTASSKVGDLVFAGTVTQADIDKEFGDAALKGLPPEAQPVVADLRSVATKLIGVPATKDSPLRSDYTALVSKLTVVTLAVCR